mgnify:CR=1 FL=1
MGQAIKKNKVEYIDKVHGDSKGWITRSCIDENGYSQWHYKYLELKETDLTGENIYITLNTFYKPCRRLECIKELNFVYIDLGQAFKNVDLTFIIVKKRLANPQFTPTFDKA